VDLGHPAEKVGPISEVDSECIRLVLEDMGDIIEDGPGVENEQLHDARGENEADPTGICSLGPISISMER
jgi:hypothetical protein